MGSSAHDRHRDKDKDKAKDGSKPTIKAEDSDDFFSDFGLHNTTQHPHLCV